MGSRGYGWGVVSTRHRVWGWACSLKHFSCVPLTSSLVVYSPYDNSFSTHGARIKHKKYNTPHEYSYAILENSEPLDCAWLLLPGIKTPNDLRFKKCCKLIIFYSKVSVVTILRLVLLLRNTCSKKHPKIVLSRGIPF